MTAKRNKEKAPSRIPEFATIEEETEFWDPHSLTEFEDELEDVTDFRIDVMRGPGYLSFRMDEEVLHSIEKRASDNGIEVEELIQRWTGAGIRAGAKKPSRRAKAS